MTVTFTLDMVLKCKVLTELNILFSSDFGHSEHDERWVKHTGVKKNAATLLVSVRRAIERQMLRKLR
jgi:hypothetical protein